MPKLEVKVRHPVLTRTLADQLDRQYFSCVCRPHQYMVARAIGQGEETFEIAFENQRIFEVWLQVRGARARSARLS